MSEATIAGYCRACGKALAESEVHRSHGAMYCKEHAPMEGASSSPYGAPPPPYGAPPPPDGTPPPPGPTGAYNPYPSAAGVSPVAAFWLGLIPGVGAIYNGQYAKGFVHVAVIALGFSIINNDAAGGFEPLVGMMIAAFWAYMPFEAYHTARKRQLGQPVDELSSLVPVRGARFPAIPVILIVLGTVLLLDNLRLIELRKVLRFWPMLLIGAGVYMLYNRFAARAGAQSAGSQKGGPPQ
jgi:hypothetical protein